MKTTAETLLNEIADDFSHYLKVGNFTSFSRKIDPALNIDEMEKLLRIHFVLTEKNKNNKVGVIDFIRKLRNRLRRIKTTLKKEEHQFNGEVRGRICWKATINRRLNQNPEDKTLFICTQKEKNYNIPENLILKKLLQIIHGIVYKDLEVAIKNEYDWVSEWTEDKNKLLDTLNRTFLKNVYLRRIELEEVDITPRMIYRAKNSRLPLYKEAAYLLSRYQKLMNYELDGKEARELLRNTFIKPEKTEVLFELYWTVMIIKGFRKKCGFENIKYKIIEPKKNIIAEWEYENNTYRLYHDSTGSFKLSENVLVLSRQLKDKDNYLGRELKVFEKLEGMAGVEKESLWGGRPDILLERYDKQKNLISIFIGEVKYTNNRNYIIQGLKELLEYMALIKKDNQYIENYNDVFEKLNKVKGALFIDKTNNINIKGEDNIQIIMFGDDIKNLVI